jgi:4-hydroxybenzoate polyprenyltransferase
MTDRDLQNKRFVAAVVDVGVAIAIGLAFGILSVILGFAFGSGTLGSYVPRVLGFLGSLVGLGYILARDVIAGDRSLGKKVQNIRVVALGGRPITFMESARRNAIFAIGSALGLVSSILGLLPCLGDIVRCLLMPVWILGLLVALGAAIFEIIKIAQDPEGIRTGDQMAGTRVVR